MRHLRVDYTGIQDTSHSTSIGDDEPVFIVRAKDRFASQAVRVWAAYVLAGGGDPTMVARVQEWADEMDAYRREHFNGGKTPDVPQGMLLPSSKPQAPEMRFCPHCGVEMSTAPHNEDCEYAAVLARAALERVQLASEPMGIEQSPGMRRI
jgi:hypothetical protein